MKARVDRSMMTKTTCQMSEMQTADDREEAYPESLTSSLTNSLIVREIGDDCWDRRDGWSGRRGGHKQRRSLFESSLEADGIKHLDGIDLFLDAQVWCYRSSVSVMD